MNLKSYLKGIGVGMIVASLILIISGNLNKGMSDENVIKRAKELGMIEASTVSNENTASSNEPVDISSEDKSKVSDTGNSSVINDDKSNSSDALPEVNSNSTEDKNGTDVNTDTADNQSDKSNDSSDSVVNTDTMDNQSDNISNSNDSTAKNADDSSAENNSEDSDDANNDNKTVSTGETVKVEVKSGMSSESVASAVMKAGLVESDTEFNKYLCENGYDKRLRVGSFEIQKGSDFETISKSLCGIK